MKNIHGAVDVYLVGEHWVADGSWNRTEGSLMGDGIKSLCQFCHRVVIANIGAYKLKFRVPFKAGDVLVVPV